MNNPVKKTLTSEHYLVTHSVGLTRVGQRLDRFLRERYRRRSREQLKRAIEVGAITVQRNGSKHLHLGRVKPSFILQKGDVVEVLSVRKPEPLVNFNYQILFEDEDIIVINKPPNLPVHPAGKFFFHTLLVHLKTRGFTAELESDRKYFLVHRIDKETSGILLLAKSKEACTNLTGQFRNRETDKYYLAIVHGKPEQPAFEVDVAMGRVSGSRVGLKMFAVPEENGGLPAMTRFELVETRTGVPPTAMGPLAQVPKDFSLIACFPRTGRQHQIRVHADHAHVPLVGDKIYGLSDFDAGALIDGYREHGRSEASPEPEDESVDLDEGETPDFETELNSELDVELEGELNADLEVEMEPSLSNDFDSELAEEKTLSPALGSSEERRATEDNQPLISRVRRNAVPFSNRTPIQEFIIPGPTATHYAEISAKLLLPRHALHAAGLRFKHPRTNKDMVFECNLPEDLREFFEAIEHRPLEPFRTKNW
jgi:23S rRNA pseudouridine1911/1915/1917 synthase